MSKILLPVGYLCDISYYRLISGHHEILIEKFEHFVKQTPRSRTVILGPNGKQMLVIPVLHSHKGHTCMKDVRIDNSAPWQKIHWRSLEAGYRRSAYFEFYEDAFRPVYERKPVFLFDFNLELTQICLRQLRIDKKIGFTESYKKTLSDETDYRISWPVYNHAVYPQVFVGRNEFSTNMSIVDLIFNLGPKATEWLMKVEG